MRYLLDTHAAIYFLEGDRRLTRLALEVIDDPSCKKFFSLANMWEIAIKLSIGKIELDADFEEIPEKLKRWSIQPLEIELPHLMQVSLLPLHHRDPFDRLLVAQCTVGKLKIG